MIQMVEEIWAFWFDETKSFAERVDLWFGGSPNTDRLIKDRFETLVIRATAGEFDHWANSPRSCLALVILLDQFPLNIYRDKAKGYEIIEAALPIAEAAVKQGFDLKLGLFERFFLYLPFEHSEEIQDQKTSMQLFNRLLKDATETKDPKVIEPMTIFHDYALKHYEVIKRFGRYPDRNPILGRSHSKAEAQYMADGGPPF